MNHRIINRPTPVSLSVYEEEIEQYVDDVSKVKGVVSVYTMGSVGAPGLSDIDIIVVVVDDFEPSRSNLLSTRDRNDQLYIHGPIVIPESLAESLQYIVYASGLEVRFGLDLLRPIEALPPVEQKSLKYAYLIDFLESRQIQHANVDRIESIDMRSWLARVWSLTHSEKLLLDSGLLMDEEESNILADIRRIRKRWQKEETVDDTEFISAYLGAISLSRGIWEKAINHCYKDVPNINKEVKGFIGNKFIHFSSLFRSCEAQVRLLRIPKSNTLLYKCKMNSRYLSHLKNYGYVFNDTGQSIDTIQNPLMEKRSFLVREHWRWLKEHSPDADSMSGYLGLGGSSMSCRSSIIAKIYAKAMGYSEGRIS